MLVDNFRSKLSLLTEKCWMDLLFKEYDYRLTIRFFYIDVIYISWLNLVEGYLHFIGLRLLGMDGIFSLLGTEFGSTMSRHTGLYRYSMSPIITEMSPSLSIWITRPSFPRVWKYMKLANLHVNLFCLRLVWPNGNVWFWSCDNFLCRASCQNL